MKRLSPLALFHSTSLRLTSDRSTIQAPVPYSCTFHLYFGLGSVRPPLTFGRTDPYYTDTFYSSRWVSLKGERNRTHPNANERTRTQTNATERKRTHPNANEHRRMQGSLVDVNDWANTGRVLSFAAIRQVQN